MPLGRRPSPQAEPLLGLGARSLPTISGRCQAQSHYTSRSPTLIRDKTPLTPNSFRPGNNCTSPSTTPLTFHSHPIPLLIPPAHPLGLPPHTTPVYVGRAFGYAQIEATLPKVTWTQSHRDPPLGPQMGFSFLSYLFIYIFFLTELRKGGLGTGLRPP